MPPRSADLELLVDAAAEAGRIALSRFRKNPDVWMKPGDSPVSDADLAVDTFLRDALLAARPDYGWLSEETADDPARLERARTFVVDPIDGTRAFIEGRETWCVSVAVVEKGRAIAGVIDCPAKQEVFLAEAGGGAFRNGERIFVRAVGGSPVVGGPKAMLSALPSELRERVRHRGYIPSLAYRLAMVAEGTLDASFVKPHSHDWDIAAADLVLAEAGGTLRDPQGMRPQIAGPEPRHGALVAGHGPLLEAMTKVIAQAA
ncbi:MAG: 3'(2'),5'-bisphosphate nucleotidase CysQ [Rhizobiaceae bacterium]|nr:3'(2'),5'-bisphosphate nucleotidase CysQ [Rhizobiaceae bacterium]MCV0406166.1 3'(2'),5'-bisphosphate nucleotidase CysQ [Rhizobiaceae bacterium]